ncbi:MAG: hypothetical protein AAF766_07210 [Cyanobacteria bacterium P01_D01_bin.14]
MTLSDRFSKSLIGLRREQNFCLFRSLEQADPGNQRHTAQNTIEAVGVSD